MRILHCISSIDPRAGGPAVAVAGLARAQAGIGQEVRIAATFAAGEDGAAAEALRRDGVGVERIGPCHGALGRHERLKEAIEREVAWAQVVHIHGMWEEIQHQGARAARRLGRAYVIRPCGMLDPWSLAQSRWKKRAYLLWRGRKNLNGAAAIHFTSEIERELVEPLGLKTPGIVEPNGLDLGEFAALPPEGAFRGRHPELRGQAMILFLGRIHPKKGLDLLIPALARLGKEARLVIAGPDQQGYRTVVEGMIRREGVGDRVIFTGMLHGMERVAALRDADLFVLPSYQENFGIAVAEALAAGTPVVISDQVNIHREIAAAGVGQVVETNVAPLAAAIEAWLGDEKRRRSAGERGRDFVRERYDWRRIAEAWREHYGQWRKRDG